MDDRGRDHDRLLNVPATVTVAPSIRPEVQLILAELMLQRQIAEEVGALGTAAVLEKAAVFIRDNEAVVQFRLRKCRRIWRETAAGIQRNKSTLIRRTEMASKVGDQFLNRISEVYEKCAADLEAAFKSEESNECGNYPEMGGCHLPKHHEGCCGDGGPLPGARSE